jgi:glycosidase
MKTAAPLFNHPEWSQNAVIYELNVRQFSPDGTLAAILPQLPRLKKMGVDIIWLMPINPIGVKNSKGTLGSNYSVSDYKAVNPDFGTLDDFKNLVKATHDLGMYLIIDWVANHTAWDHVWVEQHPEWYIKNAEGQISSYEYDNGKEIEYWTDVLGLDYMQPALWDAMNDALLYWVKEADIDGYRCDVAGLLPTAYWEQVRVELDKVKPVFMLAEWSTLEMHRSAFDMTYDWPLYDLMVEMAKGDATALRLRKLIEHPPVEFPQDAYRMRFTTNHDKNSWEGNDVGLFGAAFKAYAVLAATLPGMMLIYSGQESGLGKCLQFFEKDPIEWGTYAYADFYRELTALKHKNKALWSGQYGGSIDVLPDASRSIFAYRRVKGANKITVLINFSKQTKKLPASADHPEIILKGYDYAILKG